MKCKFDGVVVCAILLLVYCAKNQFNVFTDTKDNKNYVHDNV
jgi:hypothetical protein